MIFIFFNNLLNFFLSVTSKYIIFLEFIMKKVFMMLVLTLSISMFSCDSDSKKVDMVASCEKLCEVDKCFDGGETVATCKADCNDDSTTSCVEECIDFEEGTETECQEICNKEALCEEKTLEVCGSEASALFDCLYSCLESKNSCEEQFGCYFGGCATQMATAQNCQKNITECEGLEEE